MADPHPRAANSEMSPAALLPGCDSVVRLMRERWLAVRLPCGRSPVPRWRGGRVRRAPHRRVGAAARGRPSGFPGHRPGHLRHPARSAFRQRQALAVEALAEGQWDQALTEPAHFGRRRRQAPRTCPGGDAGRTRARPGARGTDLGQADADVSILDRRREVTGDVITRRSGILEGLAAAGFTRGMTPARPRLRSLAQLGPLLLTAFDSTSTGRRE